MLACASNKSGHSILRFFRPIKMASKLKKSVSLAFKIETLFFNLKMIKVVNYISEKSKILKICISDRISGLCQFVCLLS